MSCSHVVRAFNKNAGPLVRPRKLFVACWEGGLQWLRVGAKLLLENSLSGDIFVLTQGILVGIQRCNKKHPNRWLVMHNALGINNI